MNRTFNKLVEKYIGQVSRGAKFGKCGIGKSGPIKSKKDKKKSAKGKLGTRQQWKKQSKNYI